MARRTLNGKPLRHLPAIADLLADGHGFVVVMKSAQVGASEALVNLALWAADSGYGGRGNVLFAMPTQNMMDDFAQARFDKAIQDSTYLRTRLQPEPPRRKGADSKRLKRIGPGYLYLRGTDSRRQLASIDADLVILDEFDQMAVGTLELARKRLSSSRAARLWIASTPRIPEAGIDELFLHSDQRRFFLPCPACGQEQCLRWDDNVDKGEALIVCVACHSALDLQARGRWIAQAPGNSRVHGYHLSRLYSPWANLGDMIAASEETGVASVQEFLNSDLGEPFSPPGGGLSLDTIDRCRGDYALADYAGQPCVAGVDVGLVLHVIIRERRPSGDEGTHRARLRFAGELHHWEELAPLLARFNVDRCVIDAQPEVHKAREFATSWSGNVWLAQYTRREPGHEIAAGRPSIFHVNRTDVFDEMVGRFCSQLVELPAEARTLGGRLKDGYGSYYRQLLAPQRVLEQDANGNWVGRWRDNGKADHFAHSEVYALLAARPENLGVWEWYTEDLARTRREARGVTAQDMQDGNQADILQVCSPFCG